MAYLTSNLTSDTSGYNYNVKLLHTIHNITYNNKKEKTRRQLATKLAQRQLMAWYKISQYSFPHIVRTAYRTESVLCSFYRHFDFNGIPVV